MPYNFPWECPFCGRATTITDPNVEISMVKIGVSRSKNSSIGFTYKAIACPNQECKELFFSIDYHTTVVGQYEWVKSETIKEWKLLPESLAKPQPEYIPEAIREDYFEACRIRELSPKASAALARRCLQGMIRDFWDIQKGRLIDEILELKNHVESTIWGAIDAVREVGNIGAHMEKDVNLIIDVEPGEAEKILGLIELLLKEWYVARKEREDRVNEVIKIGKEKVEEKKNKQ